MTESCGVPFLFYLHQLHVQYVLLVLKHEAKKELLLGIPLLGCSKKALFSFKLVFEYETRPHIDSLLY